jgi:hypothetical protein
MNKATFIISLDCEGKWGMADNITPEHTLHLTNNNLNKAYRKLTQLFDHYQMKATFAFVGAILLSKEEYMNRIDWFQNVKINHTNWLDNFLKDAEKDNFDGWLNPRLLDIVQSYNNHEIASHGFSHLPLSEHLISNKVFELEMKNMKRVMAMKDLEAKTFIYPRNIVGFTSKLITYGIKGYRSGNSGNNTLINKSKNFLDEIKINQEAENHSIIENPIEIPSGKFLNWRSNKRRIIPIFITSSKWKHAIDDAIKRNKVVHLWTHPHNFITGNKQYKLLSNILEYASDAIHNEKMINLTQKDYCKEVLKQ